MPQPKRRLGKNTLCGKLAIGYFLSALCLASVFSSARASDVITVSTAHYPPLSLRDASDGKRGIVIDIAAEVFDRIGQSVEFQFLPWKRALNYAQTGKVHAMLPLFFTAERSKTLEFVYPPIFHLEIVLFARRGIDNNFDGTVNSIRGKSVVFISGTSQNDDFDPGHVRMVAYSHNRCIASNSN